MNIIHKRIQTYWIVALTLSVGSVLMSNASWQGTAYLHTLMETLATVLALFVGLLALVRFYSRSGTDYLVLGAGFLGVGMLDGYHAIVTSSWFKSFYPSDLSSLIPWSWLASRLFLSSVILLLYFILKYESEHKAQIRIAPKFIYWFILISSFGSFLFFAFVPLPSGYFNNTYIQRPEELIPAIFFTLALAGFIKLGGWHTNDFSHWLILMIIVNLVTQLVVMPYSGNLFDIQFDLAHLLKKLSYLCVLCGLCISVFRAFKEADSQESIRKKAQISLEASEVRNRTMMNSLVDGLISINEKGIIENINNSACRLYGYSKLEILGKNIKILMPNPYQSEHDEYLSNYLRTGKGKVIGNEVKVTGLKKDGSIFPMELSVSKMIIGGKTKYSGIIRDDTERLKNENELIKAKEDAQRADVAKSNFLASMSHEIRTPMNGVLGMIELLQDTPLNTQQEDIVKTISNSGLALLEIINDILEYSKIEAGKIEIELIKFNLEQTIYDVTHLLLVKAEEKNIELSFYYHTDCPTHVIGDAGRIRQIMLNLVGNAVKFTDKGRVLVEVKCQSQVNNHYNICIEVTDTGIGLDNRTKQKIFESFTQADNSTSRKFGGTGLGLSISKQLVELMNGKLNVKSIKGEGSTFWIELNLENAEFQDAIERTGIENISVLIVDENPVNLKILRKQLEKFRMLVDDTLNPLDALPLMISAKQSGNEYKLVIIENKMSELSGDNLGRIILSHKDFKHTPLIILTSSSGLGKTKVFKDIGFSAYLTKPILSDMLYKTLSHVLITPDKNNENNRILTRHSIIDAELDGKYIPKQLNGKILLVEDILINQKVALGLLNSFNLEIDIANNGKEALEKYTQVKYDIILMDCQMPIMDGFEATKIIRKTDKSTPIIAVTANALSTDRDKCNQAGMNDYLAKPFNRQQLIDILDRWLNNQKNEQAVSKAQQQESNLKPGRSLNYGQLSNMKATIGPVFNELIPAYLEQSDEMISSMMDLLDNNKISTLERYAHSMKSSSLNVGADSVSEYSLTLEKMCKNNTDKVRIKSEIELVTSEYTKTKKALLEYHKRGNLSDK